MMPYLVFILDISNLDLINLGSSRSEGPVVHVSISPRNVLNDPTGPSKSIKCSRRIPIKSP